MPDPYVDTPRAPGTARPARAEAMPRFRPQPSVGGTGRIASTRRICIPTPDVSAGLPGTLTIPDPVHGCIIFAHGSGSNRLSPRNMAVSRALLDAGFATLLFDLLTPSEASDRTKVFDIARLSKRMTCALDWVRAQPGLRSLPKGLYGASTGAAAAIRVAADQREAVAAVVSRGGRADLAEADLGRVRCPVLMIVGGADDVVLDLNRLAQRQLRCENALSIVPGATHLFSEPGALDEVARLTRNWFLKALTPEPT